MKRCPRPLVARWLGFAVATALLAGGSIHGTISAFASGVHAPQVSGEREVYWSGRRAGPQGRVTTVITSDPFTVADSPYMWTIEVGQSRPGSGEPIEDPYFEVRASRHADGEEGTEQAHIWRFRLPPGSLSFDGRLRHGEFDTGSISGYGSAAMEMVSLGGKDDAKDRCEWTHRVLRKRDWRSGVLVGSFSFAPGYADPDLPSVVEIQEVPATIQRSRLTGATCLRPTCSGERIFEGSDPVQAYVLWVREDGSGTTLRFTYFQYSSVSITVKHQVIARSVGNDTLLTTPTDAQIVGDIAQPFIDFGTGLRWAGEASPRETPRCIYERRNLFGGGTNYFDVYLDSGDLPLLTHPEFATLSKRTPP